jgi:hypothetical protein
VLFAVSYRYTVAVLAFALLAMCACSSVSDPGALPKAMSPKVGSNFRYQLLYLDTLGHEVRDPKAQFGDTVLATGLAIYGKDNMTEFSYRKLTQLLPAFRQYESNGDLTLYSPPMLLQDTGDWFFLPLATKGYEENPTSVSPTHMRAFSYIGSSTRWFAGKQFNTAQFAYLEGPSGALDTISRNTYDVATGILVESREKSGLGVELIEFNLK